MNVSIQQLNTWSDKLRSVPWRMVLLLLGSAFLLATVFSTILAQIFMPDKIDMARKPRAVKSSMQMPSSVATLNQPALDLILTRNIFNSEGPAIDGKVAGNIVKQPHGSSAVKTDLPLKLHGTIVGADSRSGIAMIESLEGVKGINSFMLGDTVPPDAVVKEILREKVIFDRGGRLEYLEVEKPEIAGDRRRKKSGQTSAKQVSSPLAAGTPPETYKEEGFERKGSNIEMTQAYKEKLLTVDFTQVLQDAKATPHIVDGQFKGFEISKVRANSIYEKAGLMNGDIIEEINGMPLTDVAQTIKLLQSLRNATSIDVRRVRNGVPETIVVGIR